MRSPFGRLLQKSKIEEARKSRENRFLDAPAAARLSGANTQVGGHFQRGLVALALRRDHHGAAGVSAMPTAAFDFRGKVESIAKSSN